MKKLNFQKLYLTGLSILNDEINKKKPKQLSAELAFKLYDTYGFPVDVTQNILTDKGIKLDINQYLEIVKENKERQKIRGQVVVKNQLINFFLNLKTL